MMNRYEVVDQDPFHGETHRLNFTSDGRRMASFIYPTDWPTHFRLKPEFHPLCTPAGMPVTDTHPYCFIHHQAVMAGHGKVLVDGSDKQVDFYRKLSHPDPGRIDFRHRPHFDLFQMGPSGMQYVTDSTWRVCDDGIAVCFEIRWQTRVFGKEEGDPLVNERRCHYLQQIDNVTVLDHYSELRAVDQPVTFRADRHSFTGIRVHDLIDVDDGGEMRDSDGKVNETGFIKDRSPNWVDVTGQVIGHTFGATLMAHPSNVRNQWYNPPFGLMEVSPALQDECRFTADEPLTFAARYVAHDGPCDASLLNKLFDGFAKTSDRDVLNRLE